MGFNYVNLLLLSFNHCFLVVEYLGGFLKNKNNVIIFYSCGIPGKGKRDVNLEAGTFYPQVFVKDDPKHNNL